MKSLLTWMFYPYFIMPRILELTSFGTCHLFSFNFLVKNATIGGYRPPTFRVGACVRAYVRVCVRACNNNMQS